MTGLPTTAFKILSRADWRATLAEGAYDGSPVDHADGYIHMSTEAQLAEVDGIFESFIRQMEIEDGEVKA